MSVATMTWLVGALACVAAIQLGRRASKLGIFFGGFLIAVLATLAASVLVSMLDGWGLLRRPRHEMEDFQIFIAFFMTPAYWFLGFIAHFLSGSPRERDGRD